MGHDEYEEVEEFEEVEEDLAFSLTDQFFIRRNGKVKGPMDAKHIRKLVKSKKLKPSDQVSLSVDGSWDRLSNAYKDIMSGTYVDSTATMLPPRKSNRKKKVDKPLDGVEWLGSEGHIARMAMYQKYRTTLHITAGVVAFIIVVGGPILWITGTDYWTTYYENDGPRENEKEERAVVEARRQASGSRDPVANFKSILYSENELVSRSFRLKLTEDYFTYTYVPKSLAFDVKETNSLVYKYEAYLEFKANQEKDGDPDYNPDGWDPEYWKFKFLYDGTKWRCTEYTLFGNVKGGGTFHEFIAEDFLWTHMGMAVKVNSVK